MAQLPRFDEHTLQAICNVIGDTTNGLTGSEIGRLLRDCRIDDPYPTATKRTRLFTALSEQQTRDGVGNNVAGFIVASMKPVRYVQTPQVFTDRLNQLNEVMAFAGLSIGEDGSLRVTSTAKTISEAVERAGKLRRHLLARNVHSDVLMFCRAELVQDNYFHAVFEAAKSVADKIRTISGLVSDGSKLVDEAFSFGASGIPRVAFNSLRTETERSEHTGLMNLMKGLFGTFRNTTAHAPKIKWPIDEADALDMLTLASLLHRRLDMAVRTHTP